MNAPADEPRATEADMEALLGVTARRRGWQRLLPWLLGAAAVAALIGVAWWQSGRGAAAAPAYVTVPVVRGNLSLKVTANGTLQPTRTFNIGSELSGTVSRVLVDVNDRVRRGQVLVELDTSKLRDQVTRTRAGLASARAKVAQVQSTLKEAQAGLARQEEVARLSGGRVPSAAELDASRAALERAQADLASANANVDDAQAQLSTDETNLAKASIRSPIDGAVLTRSVDPGNAVAASLQAVTLFTLAEDLRQLKLQVNVDEADVGLIQAGQRASFTVSAYPNRSYPATITRVAYGSTTTDNVVTYTTLMDVANDDATLRPGMTATATIVATERTGVLLVPSTALRFSPREAAAAPRAAASSGTSIVARMFPRPPTAARRPASAAGRGEAAGVERRLWLLRDGQPVAATVSAGASDGRQTEVSAPGLEPGQAVITDQRAGAAR